MLSINIELLMIRGHAVCPVDESDKDADEGAGSDSGAGYVYHQAGYLDSSGWAVVTAEVGS